MQRSSIHVAIWKEWFPLTAAAAQSRCTYQQKAKVGKQSGFPSQNSQTSYLSCCREVALMLEKSFFPQLRLPENTHTDLPRGVSLSGSHIKADKQD